MTAFTEAVAEHATLERFGKLGYRVIHGPNVAPTSRRLKEAPTNTVLQQAELLSGFWTGWEEGVMGCRNTMRSRSAGTLSAKSGRWPIAPGSCLEIHPQFQYVLSASGRSVAGEVQSMADSRSDGLGGSR